MGKLIPFDLERFSRKRIAALPEHSPRRKAATRAVNLWKRVVAIEKKTGLVKFS